MVRDHDVGLDGTLQSSFIGPCGNSLSFGTKCQSISSPCSVSFYGVPLMVVYLAAQTRAAFQGGKTRSRSLR